VTSEFMHSIQEHALKTLNLLLLADFRSVSLLYFNILAFFILLRTCTVLVYVRRFETVVVLRRFRNCRYSLLLFFLNPYYYYYYYY